MISKNKLPSNLTTNIDPKQFGVSGTKQAINLYTSAISQQVQQQIAVKLKAEYEAKFIAELYHNNVWMYAKNLVYQYCNNLNNG